MSGKFLAVLLLSFSFFNLTPGRAAENTGKYLSYKEPRRVALIIGNSAYRPLKNERPKQDTDLRLPGAVKDAEAIYLALSKLGFQDKPITNVKTASSFENDILAPFLDKLEEGDFVVVYFSGHGFTYDGNSYLVPTQFPNSAQTTKSDFISLDAVRDKIAAYKPGQLITILDACRAGFDFAQFAQGIDRNLLKKGFPEPTSNSNEIIAYASAPKTFAYGSNEEKLSVYTEQLTKRLGTPGQEWEDLVREVRFAVKTATADTQIPWISASRSSYIFFKPSSLTYKNYFESWSSTLVNGGTYETVTKFVEFFPISPYTSAARQWLKDHPNRDFNKFTQVSPSLIEKSWTTSSLSGETAVVPRVAEEVAFPRRQLASSSSIIDVSDASLSDVLIDAGVIITLARLNGRELPSLASKVVTSFNFGKRLKVLTLVPDARGQGQWFKVLYGDDRIAYIRFAKRTSLRPIDLGFPVKEFLVKKRDQSLPTLVDEKQLNQAVKELRKKYRLSWASIATSRRGSNEDRALSVARANNAASILNGLGLSRKKITILEQGDVIGDFVRVRLFGKS